jgi:F-type H+-transporting ATPase subunit delta
MADFETAARPYARAIFELASADGTLQKWEDQLSAAAMIAVDPEMQSIFERPAILAHERAELFLSVLNGAGVDADDELTNLIRLLADNGRLPAIPAIAEIFATLKQEAEGKIEVRVRSAHALTDAQEKKIAESMAKRLGKEVSITSEVDESLIAGAVITAGDLVIDGSASGRMDKLSLAVNK